MKTSSLGGIRTRRPLAAALAIWTAVFALSCRLAPEAVRPPSAGSERSAAQAATDTLRSSLAAYAYAQADVFFHQGVGHKKERAFDDGFFRSAARAIAPEEHGHLAGPEIREIMPWLRFAMDLDPRQTEYPMVAAFWLATHAGRPDLAHEVLREGRINNPRDCRLAAEEARLCLRQGRMEDARRLFDLAVTLGPQSAGANAPEDARLLKREILLYRSLLAEAAGDRTAAVADLRGILDAYPDMESMRLRIRDIESGATPDVSAGDVLKNLIRDQDDLHEDCGREDHDQGRDPADTGHPH